MNPPKDCILTQGLGCCGVLFPPGLVQDSTPESAIAAAHAYLMAITEPMRKRIAELEDELEEVRGELWSAHCALDLGEDL